MSIMYAFSLTSCGDKNDDERSSEASTKSSFESSQIENDDKHKESYDTSNEAQQVNDNKNDDSSKIVAPFGDTISAGNHLTTALKSDGTLVAAGDNKYGQCDVSDWTAIRIPQ